MRGTHQIFRHVRGKVGIIPAYAGNTGVFHLLILNMGDHPRVCGEHAVRFVGGEVITGSSPRMRGTHSCVSACSVRLGIIPAYAGNTHWLAWFIG